jgi:CRISPR-associated protein Cas1
MGTLYVIETGAVVEKRYHQLVVSRHDEVIAAVPLAGITEVVLVGQAGVTTPALHALLSAGVGLTLLTRGGRLAGRLRPPGGGNLSLRRAQYACGLDGDFCLRVARAAVVGKLRNCHTLAIRLARRRALPEAPLARLARAASAAPHASALASLRGIEGTGARAYFRLLSASLPPEMAFHRRTRRPPTDPANALLSLGYTLLASNMTAAVEIAGLDPYDGFYHADRAGRPALALDLIEEFRPVIVDSVVLTVLNRRALKTSDFESHGTAGVFLRPRGFKVFLSEYSRRINTEVYCPAARRRLAYRKVFEVQARRMRKVIEGAVAEYTPFRIR